MNRSYSDVVVIGAGPAGLVLSEVLARRGMSVTVVERQNDPARSPQGALLQPVTLDLLHRLIEFRHSVELEGSITAIEEYSPEEQIFAGSFEDLPGAPVGYALNVTQGMLRKSLLDRVGEHPSVAVLAGTQVRRLERTEAGNCRTVVAPVDDPDHQLTLRSRWLIAADGKQSETREMAGIDTRLEGADHTLSLVPVPTPEDYPRTIRAHRRTDGMATTVPGASPGLTYVFTHLMGREATPDQVAQWCRTVLRDEDRPLADALRSNALLDRVITITPQIVSASAWRREGVLLLGDCAHGMHNIGGQGVNTSIQDALLVAEALCRHAEDGDSGPIDDFIALRRPFIDEFQTAQQKLGSGFWPASGSTSWFEKRFEELSLGQAGLRTAWRDVIF
ncbi:FAD-dependent oxidoreductase [Streptomyces sp. OE57]|uniref:FAD-dependent oxidoreductase n=1 Tax=Streptomyces lacaronensis TaxID=3379885 RepID=UPI0039B789E7